MRRSPSVLGRPAAVLGPPGSPGQPRVDVDRETIARILAGPLDDGLARDLDAAEVPLDNSWPPE